MQDDPTPDEWRRVWAITSKKLVDELPPKILEPLHVVFGLRGKATVSEFFEALNIQNTFVKKNKTACRAEVEKLLDVIEELGFGEFDPVLHLKKHLYLLGSGKEANPLSLWSKQFSEFESITGSGPATFVSAPEWLNAGLRSQRAVCRFVHEGKTIATGFLITPTWVMTNHHVLHDAVAVRDWTKLRVSFCVDEEDSFGLERNVIAEDHDLDFAIVEIAGAPPKCDYMPIEPVELGATIKWDSPALIRHCQVIGHPNGEVVRMLSVYKSEISMLSRNCVLYKNDTLRGSSGSPVFDSTWKVIALHSSSGPGDPKSREVKGNIGIKMDVIVEHLSKLKVEIDRNLLVLAKTKEPSDGNNEELNVHTKGGRVGLWAETQRKLTYSIDANSVKGYRRHHPGGYVNDGAVFDAIDRLIQGAATQWGWTPVTFSRSPRDGDFTIVVQSKDDIDHTGATLAEAFFPVTRDRKLTLYPILLRGSNSSMVTTIAHEMGHIFGLRHSFALREETKAVRYGGAERKISIMSYGSACQLTAEDKTELRQLYDDVWTGKVEQISGKPVKLIETSSVCTRAV